MDTQKPQFMLSCAHDWVQKLPLSDNTLMCTRCMQTTQVGYWDTARCIDHYEGISSGFNSPVTRRGTLC